MATSVLERLFAEAHLDLADAATEPMQTHLLTVGYDAGRLRTGTDLLDAAIHADMDFRAARGAKRRAIDHLRSAFDAATEQCLQHVLAARIATRKDSGAQEALGLVGARRRTYAGWQQQARQFYTNALADADLARQLATFGLSEAVLSDGLATVERIGTLRATRQEAEDAVGTAAATRAVALKRLNDWLRDFRAARRIVARAHPAPDAAPQPGRAQSQAIPADLPAVQGDGR